MASSRCRECSEKIKWSSPFCWCNSNFCQLYFLVWSPFWFKIIELTNICSQYTIRAISYEWSAILFVGVDLMFVSNWFEFEFFIFLSKFLSKRKTTRIFSFNTHDRSNIGYRLKIVHTRVAPYAKCKGVRKGIKQSCTEKQFRCRPVR